MENKEAMAVLIGGKEITVVKRGAGPGEANTEVVLVLDLAVEKLPALLLAIDDEAAQIELYCGKDRKWVESLSRESQEQVVLVGEEVNSAFFDRWLARRVQRFARLRPATAAASADAAEPAKVSQASSPRRPANAV